MTRVRGARAVLPAGLAALLALGGCSGPIALAIPLPDGSAEVAYLDRTYRVRAVEDEPTPSLDPAGLTRLPDGGLAVPADAPFVTTGPAIRVAGTAARATATDVLAVYCAQRGRDVAPGWRDVVVRFDPVTADHVFYTEC